MTPLQITMMMHYYASAAPYALDDPTHANSPAVKSQREKLVNVGLLQECPDCLSGYRTTTRGDAYVDAICKLPLPVQKWVMPNAA